MRQGGGAQRSMGAAAELKRQPPSFQPFKPLQCDRPLIPAFWNLLTVSLLNFAKKEKKKDLGIYIHLMLTQCLSLIYTQRQEVGSTKIHWIHFQINLPMAGWQNKIKKIRRTTWCTKSNQQLFLCLFNCKSGVFCFVFFFCWKVFLHFHLTLQINLQFCKILHFYLQCNLHRNHWFCGNWVTGWYGGSNLDKCCMDYGRSACFLVFSFLLLTHSERQHKARMFPRQTGWYQFWIKVPGRN